MMNEVFMECWIKIDILVVYFSGEGYCFYTSHSHGEVTDVFKKTR